MRKDKNKIIRITTDPIALKVLLKDQLKFMGRYYEVVAVASEGQNLSDVQNDEGVRCISVNMTRRISPLKDFFSLVKMILLINKERPDIVHTHTPKAGIIGMLASLICKVPHRLHTVAGLPLMQASGFKRKLLLFVEELTYACATKVYPNSFRLKEYLVQNIRVSEAKLKVIGFGSSNGIDAGFFDYTDEVKISAVGLKKMHQLDHCFVFVFVGRIVKDKGIDELLKAFQEVNLEFTDTRLLIVGYEESLLDPISDCSKNILKKNSNVISVGFQSDVRPFLAASNCFVFPSYREGFPNAVLQACSMGIPCIVTDINGCNEIIQSEYNGLLVDAKDVNTLRRAMKRFLVDTALSKKLSRSARASVIEKYDRHKFHELLLSEYNEMLDS